MTAVKPTVKLIAHTEDPEKIVAAAAKLCYSKKDASELMENLTPEKIQTFISNLSAIGHESPFEHASFTFELAGVSRALLAQITRHRIASFSVRSQRYVDEGEFNYIIPPSIAKHMHTRMAFVETMNYIQEKYEALKKMLAEDPSIDPKKINEDARFVLPNACETKMVLTMNTRSLWNFFEHRCCNRAQWEIREVAIEMWRLCMEVAPNLFKFSGPHCLYGQCKEGKMSCGQASDVKAHFAVMQYDLGLIGRGVNPYVKDTTETISDAVKGMKDRIMARRIGVDDVWSYGAKKDGEKDDTGADSN